MNLSNPDQIAKMLATYNAVIRGDHFVYAKKPDGWYHGPDYVNKDALYPHTGLVSELCKQTARRIWDANPNIQVIVGPTVGGVSLSQWTAFWFNTFRSVNHDLSVLFEGTLAVCADEEDVLEDAAITGEELAAGGLETKFSAYGQVVVEMTNGQVSLIKYKEKAGTRRILRRGYDKLAAGGKICAIVEDIVTSGNTVRKTAAAIREAGGEAAGVWAICNRSGGKVTAEIIGVPAFSSLIDLDMPMYPEGSCPICAKLGPKSVRTDLGKGKEFLARKGFAI